MPFVPDKSPFDTALAAEGITGPLAAIAQSIYQQESGSGANTRTSNAGAVGGMQIIPATFQRFADAGWDINNPEQNARAGLRYIKALAPLAGNDPRLIAAGYYGGEGAIPDAAKGIARRDPRNPKAPNTLQYADQVVARIAPEKAAEKAAESTGRFVPDEQKPETPEPSLTDRVVDVATGNLRRTETTEKLPDWAAMPELNQLSFASAKTGLGTLLSSPEETAQIIKSNFPAAEIRQDEKGNFVIKSSINGKEYAIKPGFRVSDIPRALGALAAFTPAGRASTTIPRAAAATAATQAAIEGTQAATGGTFNPADVAIAGTIGGVVPAVAQTIKAISQPVKNAFNRITGASDAAEATQASATAQNASVATPSPISATQVAPAAPVTPLAAPELTQTAKSAAQGSQKATQILSEQAAPNPQTVAAAQRLGIQDYLQPDHVTTNQAYRELAQAVKSIPGSATRSSEIQGLQKVGERADDLVTQLGGTRDFSTLNQSVKTQLMRTQQQLDNEAERLYGKLRMQIPANTPAAADNVLQFIEQRAKDLGGAQNLTAMEKSIVAKLTPKPGTYGINASQHPSYTLLDDVRKDVGAVLKNRGQFKDADTGLAKRLYGALSDDQSAVVDQFGLKNTFDAAKAAVATRKGVEDDLISLFGKTLDGSIVGDLNAAVKSVSSGDTTKLVNLLKVVPEEMRPQLMASGLNTAFGRATQNGSLNFNTFARWYEGLLNNKRAHAAVMSNLPPQARKQISDLYRVSKGISDATRERITTGRIQAINDEFKSADSLLANLYGIAKRSAAGVAAEAVTTPLGIPGAGISAGIASALTKGKTPAIEAVDKLISSPAFTEAVKQSATNPQKAALRLAYSNQFKNFVKAAGNPRELSNAEQWILTSIEAQNQSRSGE